MSAGISLRMLQSFRRCGITTIGKRRLALASMVALALIMLAAVWSAVGGSAGSEPKAAASEPAAPRVALQVGHWRHEDLPAELGAVRRGGGGASAGGHVEWRVNLVIARATRRLLLAQGIAVDLVPATVPPEYRANAFVSIHADGNADASVTGFKTAPAGGDRSGRSGALNASLARRYARRTGLEWNTAVTRDMTDYYAFNARRFRHAISPATPAVVLETGFLSNPDDRGIIVQTPLRAAQGIATGIADFLRDPAPTR